MDWPQAQSPADLEASPWGRPELFWFRLRWQRRSTYADEINISERVPARKRAGQVLGSLLPIDRPASSAAAASEQPSSKRLPASSRGQGFNWWYGSVTFFPASGERAIPVDWIRPLKMIEDVASGFKNMDETEEEVYLAVIRGDLRARLNGKILGPEWLKQIEKLENEEPFELPPGSSSCRLRMPIASGRRGSQISDAMPHTAGCAGVVTLGKLDSTRPRRAEPWPLPVPSPCRQVSLQRARAVGETGMIKPRAPVAIRQVARIVERERRDVVRAEPEGCADRERAADIVHRIKRERQNPRRHTSRRPAL